MLKNSFALLSAASIVATTAYLVIEFAARNPF